MNQIVTRNGWLNGQTKLVEIRKGMTLGEFADEEMPAHLRPIIHAQLNGAPLKEWEKYIPSEGDHILLYVVPQGGGDGKNQAIFAVAAIAIALAAPGAGGVLFGMIPYAGWAVTGAYWVGASLVMNQLSKALFKPPQQQKPIDYDLSRNPFLYFTGIGNRMEPWGHVPRIYGRMRYFPKLIVNPEQRTEGNNIYYYLAFDFGYGPLQLSNLKLGDVNLSYYSGVSQIIHHSFTKNSVLQYFESDTTVTSINEQLMPNNANEVFAVTQNNTHKITISLFYPNGLYEIDKSTGKKASVYTQLKIYARKVATPANPWESITKFGQMLSSTLPMSGLTPWRDSMLVLQKWFANGVWNVGIKQGKTFLEIANDWVWYNVPNNEWIWIYDPSGKIAYPIKQQIGGRFTTKHSITCGWQGKEVIYGTYSLESQIPTNLSANIQIFWISTWSHHDFYGLGLPIRSAPFSNDLVIDFLEPGKYEIRISNNDLASESGLILVKDTYVSGMTSYADFSKKVFAPEVAHTVVELKIKATNQLSGMVDNFNAIAESLLPIWNGADWDVPIYDDATGLWSVPPTRNPAWIYADVLRGSANKNPINDDELDIDALVEWANENSLPAINDSDNASFNCDFIVNAETTVRETLQIIASSGRASLARKDSKYSIIRDNEDRTPVQLITSKNSNNFKASINYVKPPHGLKVSFIDETQGYSSAETIVYNDGYNQTNAIVFEEMTLPGTVRYQQAWRLGRYYLASAVLQRERVRVTMDYEQLVCQRGDLVLLAYGNDVLKAGGLPRRVNKIVPNVGGDILVLDEAVTDVFAIRYRASDTIISVVQIGDNEIRLPAGQLPPIEGDLIEYGVTNEVKAPFLVEEITAGPDFSANILLVEQRLEISDAVTQPIPPRIPRPGSSGEYVISGVINLTSTQSNILIDGSQFTRVSLNWLPPANGKPTYYAVYQVIDNIPFFIDIVESNSIEDALTTNVSLNTGSKNYTFGVEPIIDRVGAGPMETIMVTVLADNIPPPDVTGFGCNAQTGTLFLFWEKVIGIEEVDHLEIRFSSDAVDGEWGNASLLNDHVPADATDTVVPLRPGAYFIKAVDAAGNYSVNAASTVVQIDDLEYVKQFASIDFSPFDDGTYDDVYDVAGTLRLDTGAEIGFYYPDPVDYGISMAEPSKMRLYSNVLGNVFTTDNTLDSAWFIPLSNAVPLSPSAELGADAIDAQIDFRWRYTSADAWSPWTRLYVADVTAQDIEFRVMLRSRNPSYTPSVTTAGIRADWMERTENHLDIAIPSGGSHITFDHAFAEIPVVSVTLDGAHLGDYFVVSGTDRFGFDIEVFHSDNTSEAGHIDYSARGYGKGY